MGFLFRVIGWPITFAAYFLGALFFTGIAAFCLLFFLALIPVWYNHGSITLPATAIVVVAISFGWAVRNFGQMLELRKEQMQRNADMSVIHREADLRLAARRG